MVTSLEKELDIQAPYKIIEQYEDELVGACVEIGSERGHGSTTWLSEFCFERNIPFYTVDVNKESCDRVRHLAGCRAYNMLGEDFLKDTFPILGYRIGFAYLDNFDLITHDGRNWDERTALYESLGLCLNNEESAKSHLKQAKLVRKLAASTQFILIDDTWQSPKGDFLGKGQYAVPFLLKKGYQILSPAFIGDEVFPSHCLLAKGLE